MTSEQRPAGDDQWYRLDTEAVIRQLGSDPRTGLSSDEARRRLGELGPNEIFQAPPASVWVLFFDQFRNVLIVILLVAAGISWARGETVEAVAIGVIVVFAALLGFIQEYRAERALEALQELAAPLAAVLRDGRESEIPARELVAGDIVLLETGDRVPADGRLIEAVNLKTDESALTGESLTVSKQTAGLADERLPVGDRTNMVFAGTAVGYGRGRSVVVATGMATEFGRIAGFLGTVEKSRTPLQDNLDRVGRVLARVAVVIVVLVAGSGIARGLPALDMFVFGIALAVAVVPEALPAVVTISLAIGVQRMAKRNALVRHLPAVETLGTVSVICSDKTGTLTRDEMTVRKILVSGQSLDVTGVGYEPRGHFEAGGGRIEPPEPLRQLLAAAVLASDARLVEEASEGGGSDTARWQIQGDPTEGALIVAAAKAGLRRDVLEAEHPRTDEIPFSSETRRMTTLNSNGGQVSAFAKGAPEVILDSCSEILGADGVAPLDPETRERILGSARDMAGGALRVLAVASKADATPEDAETGMTFLGLLGMIDPPRPEARAAIETCVRAGIRPVMITGDHPMTASAVARELGLLSDGRAVTGPELDDLSDAELESRASDISVYARVSPEHKLRVVTALQKGGQCVAMTGDGVNDAPALKKADIGVAMGITGTDVSREASDVTLTDDNFASIVAAVEEGRAIFENIRKYLMFLLSSNLGEVLLLATSALLAWPLPLSAVQILYVNLATDGLPALALAVDPHETDLMGRRPRNPKQGIFSRPVMTLILAGGIWSGIVNLNLFNWALASGRSEEYARTMVLIGLVLTELFKAYNYRSDRHSVGVRPFANRWLNAAVAWELLLLLLVVHVPFLQSALGTERVAAGDWLWVSLMALTIFPVLEAAKWLGRRGWYGSLD